MFLLLKSPFPSSRLDPTGNFSLRPLLQSQSIFNLLYTSKIFNCNTNSRYTEIPIAHVLQTASWLDLWMAVLLVLFLNLFWKINFEENQRKAWPLSPLLLFLFLSKLLSSQYYLVWSFRWFRQKCGMNCNIFLLYFQYFLWFKLAS